MKKIVLLILLITMTAVFPAAAKEYVFADAIYGQSAKSLQEINYLLLIANSESTLDYKVVLKSTDKVMDVPARNEAAAWFYSGSDYLVKIADGKSQFYLGAAKSMRDTVQNDSKLSINIDRDGDIYTVSAAGKIASYTIWRERNNVNFGAMRTGDINHTIQPGALRSRAASKDLFSAKFIWNQKTGVLVGSVENNWKAWFTKKTFAYAGIYKNDNSSAEQGLAERVNNILNMPERTAADLRTIAQLINQERDACDEPRQGVGNVLCRVDKAERGVLRDAIFDDLAKAVTLLSEKQIAALTPHDDDAPEPAKSKEGKVRW